MLPTKVILFFAAILLSTSAFARIGETLEQLNKRYGHPSQASRGNEVYRRYTFRGFSILVALDQGVSQCEVYEKGDGSRMSEGEILGLLEANAAKSPWREEAEESTTTYIYRSADRKSRVAIYSLSAHRLLVTSKPFLAQFSNMLGSRSKSVEGF